MAVTAFDSDIVPIKYKVIPHDDGSIEARLIGYKVVGSTKTYFDEPYAISSDDVEADVTDELNTTIGIINAL